MIPIRDRNPTRRFPFLTLAFIAANVAIFVLWQPTFGADEGEQTIFYFCNAEIPYEVTNRTNLADGGAGARTAIDETFGEASGDPGDDPGFGAVLQNVLARECPDKSWLLSVFVAMFLHGGILHIAGNMLFLWVFGNNVEDRLGYLVYPAFYAMGGIAAAALQIVFDPNSAVPNLGASGAIGAVLGAYAVMFPRARVTTLVILFFITAIEVPAWILLGLWFVLQVVSGGSQLSGEAAGAGGVAYWAHVGGFAFGAIVAWLFYRPRGRDRRFAPYRIPGRPDVS